MEYDKVKIKNGDHDNVIAFGFSAQSGNSSIKLSHHMPPSAVLIEKVSYKMQWSQTPSIYREIRKLGRNNQPTQTSFGLHSSKGNYSRLFDNMDECIKEYCKRIDEIVDEAEGEVERIKGLVQAIADKKKKYQND